MQKHFSPYCIIVSDPCLFVENSCFETALCTQISYPGGSAPLEAIPSRFYDDPLPAQLDSLLDVWSSHSQPSHLGKLDLAVLNPPAALSNADTLAWTSGYPPDTTRSRTAPRYCYCQQWPPTTCSSHEDSLVPFCSPTDRQEPRSIIGSYDFDCGVSGDNLGRPVEFTENSGYSEVQLWMGTIHSCQKSLGWKRTRLPINAPKFRIPSPIPPREDLLTLASASRANLTNSIRVCDLPRCRCRVLQSCRAWTHSHRQPLNYMDSQRQNAAVHRVNLQAGLQEVLSQCSSVLTRAVSMPML